MRALELTTLGFALFCMFFCFVRTRYEAVQPVELQRSDVSLIVMISAILCVLLLGLTTLLATSTGSLNQAVIGTRLPFRLAGWLNYLRSAVLPVLMLLVVNCGLSINSRRWTAWGVGLVILLGLSEMLVRTSRAGLFTAVLTLVFMFSVSRRRIAREWIVLFAVLAFVGMLLFPSVSGYRSLRSSGESVSIALFSEALLNTTESSDLLSVFSQGAASTMARFIGVDSLLFLGDGFTPIGINSLSGVRSVYGSIAGFFTYEVLGIPTDLAHSDAPSLLGWFYMVAGNWGLTIGFGLYLALGWWVWLRIWRSQLLVKPVAQTMFLLLWLQMSSEGTLDSAAIQLLASVLSYGGCGNLVA